MKADQVTLPLVVAWVGYGDARSRARFAADVDVVSANVRAEY